jgi:hypothetical protein
VAVDDSATTTAGVAVTIPVLANDSDPDGDALNLSAVAPASNGSATVSGAKAAYTPSATFTGTDTFSYEVCDGASTPACAGATVSVTVTPPATSANALRVFGVQNEGSGTLTRSEAVAQARAFDVITARPATFKDYVADMKAANPSLFLAAYVNGTFAIPATADAYPESWFLHDADGNRITSRGWGNYLMNPAEPGWIKDRVDRCRASLTWSGYDGCFVDMLGTAPLTFDYLTSTPINPSTGAPWTRAEWIRATTNIATRIRDGVGRPLVANGLGTGWRYFESGGGATSALLSAAPRGMAEAFVRSAKVGADQFRPEDQWRQDVDMLVDAGSRGGRVLAFTKVWTSATQQQLNRLHLYALATFLLGTDGRSSFSFSTGPEYVHPHPWWSTDIGAPIASYGKQGGVYRRSFTNGLVMVNPTKTSVTVTLDATYRDVWGTARSTITLEPYTGSILTRS